MPGCLQNPVTDLPSKAIGLCQCRSAHTYDVKVQDLAKPCQVAYKEVPVVRETGYPTWKFVPKARQADSRMEMPYNCHRLSVHFTRVW